MCVKCAPLEGKRRLSTGTEEMSHILRLSGTAIKCNIYNTDNWGKVFIKWRRKTSRTSISNKPNEVKSTTPTPSVHALYSTSVLLNQLGLPKPFSPGGPKPKQQHTIRIFHYHLTMLRTNTQNRKTIRLDDSLSVIVSKFELPKWQWQVYKLRGNISKRMCV